MDPQLLLNETKTLLQVDESNRSNHWLASTFSALEHCPLEIPEVVITHTTGILPYLHARTPEEAHQGKIILKDAVHTGILDFGCGLAIHLPNQGTPALRLRYGDLVWLQMTGSLNHQKKKEVEEDDYQWGIPSPDHTDLKDGTPRSGKIAYGATLFEPIPENILPKASQETIRGFLHRVTDESMRIGLLKSPFQKTKTLCVLTKNQIGGEFNPLPLLEALCWHSPAHYTWTALGDHEENQTP